MSQRPLAVRATIVALGLALLFLVDPLTAARHGSAAAASEPDAVIGQAIPTEGVAGTGETACVSGFGDTDSKLGIALHGVTLTGRGAMAVGFSRAGESDEVGQRRPAAIHHVGDHWTRVWTSSPGAEDGLVAVTSPGGGDAWAVGFTTISGQTMPLAMRWNGRAWAVNRPKPNGATVSLFTDVAMVGSSPFAVGYRMGASGDAQPIAARKDGTRWRDVSPRAGRRESMTLTGVASDGRGGLWVVGQGGRGTEIGPVIFRRDDARWERLRGPRLKGEAVLADVAASVGDDAWAVGYQRTRGRALPLVLHWDGRGWSRVKPPAFDSLEVVLTAVTASQSDGIWVVGAAWNSALGSHEAVAARWDGQAWNEVAGIEGGTELHDVVGSPDAEGWAVGRSGLQSRTARVCLPPRTGIFGGSDPIPPQPTPDGLASRNAVTAVETRADTHDADTAPAEPPHPADADPADETAAGGAATMLAARQERARQTKARQSRARHDRARKDGARKGGKDRAKAARKHRLATLPEARPSSDLAARDMAGFAGLADHTVTYGAVAADFDGDEVDDLYIGRHGRPGLLALNRNGRFREHEAIDFPSIDRHGCSAADVDGSGLPDLYCAIGGKRGSGLKSNELWLDPGGPRPVQVAVEHGLSDPTGRGRRAVFLEAERNDDVELVVTNSPTRVDGLPSIGRLFASDGDGKFTARARTGFAAGLGSLSVQDADYDNDGREDLLLVTGGPQAPLQEGSRLYRNTRRGLVDVTRQTGIRRFGEVDAELVDLDGDAKLDLVQLSPTRLRVSQLRNGRFRKVYERRLTYGKAVSAGDADGNGRDDLYVVRSNGTRNLPDVMLVNRDAGGAWSSLLIPQVHSGDGDDAVAIDYDGNGLEDFLVLNGSNARGPIQLIAFFKP